MLAKNDCLSILVRLEDRGLSVNPYIKKLLVSKDIPVDVLKFIAQNQGIEVGNFYEMLRKKHNKNRSQLYTNILKGENASQDAVTTLTCLLTQIVLYSNKLNEAKDQFLKEVRAEEITRVLNNYFATQDLNTCISLLQLIKSDLLVIECLEEKRDFE